MSGIPWQVVSDCPHCRTEGGLIELMDPEHPACHVGVPSESRCRMCGFTRTAEAGERPSHGIADNRCPSCSEALSEGSREARKCEACGYCPKLSVTAGIDLKDAAAVGGALENWAQEEGLTSTELCEGSLGGTVDEILALYAAGERVSSSLDALAFLFPGMAAGASVGVAVEAPRPEADIVELPPEDPRAPVKLLVSVMVADGMIRSRERAFLDAYLQERGLEPLRPDELRPWRPHEVGPLRDPDAIAGAVEAAIELMHLDGERDGSELRIVRTFARAWGVTEVQIERWNRTYDTRYAPPLTLVWRALSRWVRTR